MVERRVVSSDGEQVGTHTIACTAGVRANPLAARAGLPVGTTGRLVADVCLRVPGVDGVWVDGDSARSIAGLALHKRGAPIYGIKLRGCPAWWAA